jgi:acyl dehydratase
MNVEELQGRIGTALGQSDWFLIDQDRINAFAEVTEDRQFIHMDPERTARETELGGTISHGYLTLSLLTHLSEQVMPKLDGFDTVINYGLNRLRFLHPVHAGGRIRAGLILSKITERKHGTYLVECDVRAEIENIDTPALMVTTLALYVPGTSSR